jgi:hypothetical protein
VLGRALRSGGPLFDGEEVVFRKAVGGKLAAATSHRVAAFEVAVSSPES